MSDITEPKNRFDLRWYDEVIRLRKANADLRKELELHKISADTCASVARDNAALRADKERLDWMNTNLSSAQNSERYLQRRIYWNNGTKRDLRAAIDAARAALGPASPRANCTLVAFDGAERTVTLQFDQAPSACIGEKWVATTSQP